MAGAEDCKEHSGICATITAVDKQLSSFREETKDNFNAMKADIKSVQKGFDGFKTWLLYSVLGCAFSVVTSVIVMLIKFK